MKEDKKLNQNKEVKDRRTLLKGLVAGSAVVTGSKALPETWAKPMTDAIILPGHALTTTDAGGGDTGDSFPGGSEDGDDRSNESDGPEDLEYGDSDGSRSRDGDYESSDKYENNYDNDGEGVDYGSEDDDALASDDYRVRG